MTAPHLGKRKRVTRAELEQASRSPTPSSDSNDSGAEDLQAAFRRAFEAKFKPLPSEGKKAKIEETTVAQGSGDDEQEDTDWSGVSEGEEDVEVVEYTDTMQRERDDAERALKKAFMSSKPPTSTSTAKNLIPKKKKQDDDEVGDVANLKNDLALQKLLRESHLLSASTSGTSTTALTTTGVARHKSTDLYLQSLGAKSSVFTQKRMPMAQRKHMTQKARDSETKRRADAKEAGIVLEREQKVTKVEKDRKRERSVGGPSIGRFKGGTLSLSKKDVRSITGGGGGGGAKGKGKGKKGKR